MVVVGLLVLIAFTVKTVLGGSGSPGQPAGHPSGSAKSAALDAASDHLAVQVAPWHLGAPVSRAVALPDGHDLLVLGGLATGDVSTPDIWQIDPSTGATTKLGSLPTAVHDAAGAFLGGRALVFGGGSSSTVGTVQAFSPGSGGAADVGSLPAPRSDVSAAVSDGRAYVLGGFDGSALVPDVLATSDGTHFTRVGTLVQPVRYGAAAALGGQIYVVGGELGTTESATTPTTDVQRFDPRTGTTTVIGHLPVALGHASAVAIDGQLFALGGRTATGPSAAIYRIDPRTGKVTTAGTLPSPRSDAAVAEVGDRAYLVGGETTGPTAPLDTVLVASLDESHGAGPPDPDVRASRTGTTNQPGNIYAADGPTMLSPAVRNVPYRIYVPESGSSYVDVIDPYTYKVVDRYYTGLDPQHVIPAWNLKTIYAANDLGNSLTPISPYTGKPEGPNIPVTDPYNIYFTPNGHYAIVVEEARQILAFRNPDTWALEKAVPVNCPGVDHGDFSADGSYAIFSCEFSSKMVKIDLKTLSVAGYLTIPGSAPQDVKIDPQGNVFYTADLNRGGVYLISAADFKVIGFIPTGRDAHGLYVSRTAKYLYVSNRGAGSVSVISFAQRKVVQTWVIPGGGSPDMGNLSPDGKVLWLSGRYNACVYAISTVTGKLLAEIPVPNMPHGLLPWPQPGRYSIGHTGIMR